VAGAGGTEDVPYGVAFELEVETVDLDTAAVSFSAELLCTISGDGGGAGDQQRLFCSFRNHFSFRWWVTPRNRALTLTIAATARDDNLGATVGGFNAANVGTNEAIMCLTGLRF
jgi:hypothetical protein